MSPGYVQQGVGYCVLLDSPGADSTVASSFSHPHDVMFLDTRWKTTARYSGWLGLTSMSSALIIFFSIFLCQSPSLCYFSFFGGKKRNLLNSARPRSASLVQMERKCWMPWSCWKLNEENLVTPMEQQFVCVCLCSCGWSHQAGHLLYCGTSK